MSTPRSVRSIAELPPIIQNAVAFIEVATTLGFPEDAVAFPMATARQLDLDCLAGLDPADPVVSASLTYDGCTCSYVLGVAMPDHDAWLDRAKALWRYASKAERLALYESSPIFKREHFENLVHSILLGAGMVPPIAPGLVYGRLAAADFAEVIRSQPPVADRSSSPPTTSRPAARTSAARARAPAGSPRWQPGKVQISEDPYGVLEGIDVDDFVARHLAGDWGESRFVEENEHALRTGRSVMSVFETEGCGSFWITTSACRTLTTVTPQQPLTLPDEVYMDLVCEYVATCRRSELPAEPTDALYCPAYLIGWQGAGSGMDEERAVLLLFAMIAQSRYSEVPMRYEQALWALRRAALDIDFRPIDSQGRRHGIETSKAEHDAAEEACSTSELCAWFLMRWEQRLA